MNTQYTMHTKNRKIIKLMILTFDFSLVCLYLLFIFIVFFCDQLNIIKHLFD